MIGQWKEARLTGRAELAEDIMQIINNDNLDEFLALAKIEKIARKAIKKESKYWEKTFR